MEANYVIIEPIPVWISLILFVKVPYVKLTDGTISVHILYTANGILIEATVKYLFFIIGSIFVYMAI